MNRTKDNRTVFLLYFSWLVSLIATLGSLYFSEIKGFIPCELCWYQRILMYPSVLILGIATYKKDSSVVKYILPLSMAGSLLSIMHYLQQKNIVSFKIKTCVNSVPCETIYIDWFGFVTIPFLAFVAFSMISILLIILATKTRKN